MFVVTLPSIRAGDAARFAREAKVAGADMLEIRGDLTPEPSPPGDALPLLLAPRGASFGWARRSRPALLDLEEGEPARGIDALRVMRSHHDYERTPNFADLAAMARRLRRSGADVIKIATRVTSHVDLLALYNLQDEVDPEGPHVILGMGEGAALSRWLSPWRNSLTYTHLVGETPSADGQIPLDQYRRFAGGAPPRLLGILGGMSMTTSSPRLHHTLIERHRVRAVYLPFPTSDFSTSFKALARLGVEGFSVTSPFKIAAAEAMDELDADARTIGAVNTCVIRDGRWIGLQYDATGFERAWRRLAGKSSARVVGSGGAAAAVVLALQRLDIGRVTLCARNRQERRRLAQLLGAEEEPIEALGRTECDVLVWALPVDRDDLALPNPGRGGIAIDLRYGRETTFMARARESGWTVADGTGMLVEQALLQFEAFTGERSDASDRDALLS